MNHVPVPPQDQEAQSLDGEALRLQLTRKSRELPTPYEEELLKAAREHDAQNPHMQWMPSQTEEEMAEEKQSLMDLYLAKKGTPFTSRFFDWSAGYDDGLRKGRRLGREENKKGAKAPVDSTSKSSLRSQSDREFSMKQDDWIEACKEIASLKAELKNERFAKETKSEVLEIERKQKLKIMEERDFLATELSQAKALLGEAEKCVNWIKSRFLPIRMMKGEELAVQETSLAIEQALAAIRASSGPKPKEGEDA